MKIYKLIQYLAAITISLSLTQLIACKKKPVAKVETKNANLPHKIKEGFRFGKRGLDLRKTRKIGFPARFKGIKKGRVVIEKRDGLKPATGLSKQQAAAGKTPLVKTDNKSPASDQAAASDKAQKTTAQPAVRPEKAPTAPADSVKK